MLATLCLATLSFQPVQLPPIRLDDIEFVERRYQMLFQGEVVGSSVFRTRRDGDALVFEEHTIVVPMDVDAISTTTTSLNGTPIRFSSQGTMGGAKVDIQVAWSQDRITGHSIFPRQAEKPGSRLEINQEQANPAFERSSVFSMVQAFPHQGEGFEFHWFDTYTGSTRKIQFAVTGDEVIEVPAGQFEVQRIELNGGQPSQVVYVSQESPRRIIRIDVVDMPWIYELVN